ncbi:DUF5689 domain-containing protein [Psychroserpens sp. MEBiC05023]
MKTLKINKLILLFLGLVVITSCVQDDDFDTPNLSFDEPNIPANQLRTLSSLAGDLAQEQDNGGTLDYTDESATVSYTFNENDEYITGYVVSSDEAGNYFEELIIQDKPENPTIGIKLLIDVNPLFTRYEVGRKVYVKINGLSVGITNGVLTIGALNGNEVDKIASSSETQFIQRSNEVATIVPLPMTISDLADDKTNLMIALSDVQFNRNQVVSNSLTYASEQSDEFDGERTLESCASSASVIFSTSTFSDFKGLSLPAGRGSVNAILTKDFFGEVFNVVINTPEDIVFDNPERCDPDFLECPDGSGGGSAIFDEDFEGFGTYASEGWDNINISGTSTDWFINGFGGNNYSRISAFNSGNTEADVWLVTPAIDLDSTTGEELSFDVQPNFDNGTNLSVWISTDYAGDPTTATWQLLDATIPVGPSGGFGNFETVGPVNISCLDGMVNIGFFYEGSDPTATTRYHVDNVEVTGN